MFLFEYLLLCRNFFDPLTLLDGGGGASFFKGQIEKKTSSAKNLKQFLSLFLYLFFLHCASIFIKTI